LKPLHWSKVDDAAIKGSLFGAIMDEEAKKSSSSSATAPSTADQPLDLAQVDALFAAKPPAAPKDDSAGGNASPGGSAPTAASAPASASAVKKDVLITLLDPKVSQKIDIATSRLRLSPSALRDALLAMDESVLPPERLSALQAVMPSSEDVEAVRAWINDAAAAAPAGADSIQSLGSAERFVAALSSVSGTPDLPTRVSLFLLKQGFGESVAGLEAQFGQVKCLLTSLRTSSALKRVFRVVLELGNYLNGPQSAKGGLHGFKLATLSLLKSTKSLDGSTSLLEVLVDTCARAYGPSLARNLFEVDLEGLSAAASLDSASLVAEKDKLKTQLAKLGQALQALEKAQKGAQPQDSSSGVPPDRFLPVMRSFLSDASGRMEALEGLVSATLTATEDACTWFGERREAKWDALLARFNDFAAAWAQAEQKGERIKAAELKRLQSDALKRQVSQRKAAGGGGGGGGGTAATTNWKGAAAAAISKPGDNAAVPAGGGGGGGGSRMGNIAALLMQQQQQRRRSLLGGGGAPGATLLAHPPAAAVADASPEVPTRRRVASKAGGHGGAAMALNDMLLAGMAARRAAEATRLAPPPPVDEEDVPPPPPPEEE
jgi:hypothetical protein